MLVLIIILSILIGLVVIFTILAGSIYKAFIDKNGAHFQLLFLAPISLCMLDKLRIFERFSGGVNKLQYKIIGVYGSRNGYQHTKMYAAQLCSLSLILLIGTTILSILADGDLNLFMFGIIFTALGPALMVRELDNKIEQRKREVIIELPEFLSKVVLLVNAGETVQKAIIRSVEQKKEPEKSPLYKELLVAVNEIKNGDSFEKALEDFSKRCNVQEVAIFITTVLLNYRRGGSEFLLSLRDLSRTLWEKRKAVTKTLGEQASSKLVFPMVLIFVVVMLIVGAPAIMLMK
jgi:tight adherence protein C